jgi:NAD-dependent oxidoreductase involved in siderophore biosynthesis
MQLGEVGRSLTLQMMEYLGPDTKFVCLEEIPENLQRNTCGVSLQLLFKNNELAKLKKVRLI